ncbi:Annexin-B12 [Drechslerella dactyloides]|uniref:Annexin-B12 n=1 Tax=Drechslerella dactyloides TaxID=74499 RepID=A0AAD6NP18_DREDA|nr:Annexin-B12 [Drechslerella dactyloides]
MPSSQQLSAFCISTTAGLGLFTNSEHRRRRSCLFGRLSFEGKARDLPQGDVCSRPFQPHPANRPILLAMSRRAYDDSDYGRDSRPVEYVPARPRSRGSNYGPPGGFPESPKDSYPRTAYPAPMAMPHAPAPPDDVYSSSHHSATIVSGRRPPSPGVRFADEHAARARSRSRPRDNPARMSGGQTDWKKVYERELAEQRDLERGRKSPTSRQAYTSQEAYTSREGPTSRGLDVKLNTDRVKGTLSLGRSSSKKEKRESDLAWSSEDSEDDKERERERERRKKERDREREQREKERERERDLREKERERDLLKDREREREQREIEIAKQRERERIEKEHHRRSGHHDSYGDPRRSAGQLQQHDPRRSAGNLASAGAVASAGALALVSAHEADRISREKAEKRRSGYYEESSSSHYGDPRRSTGQIHDPRRSAGNLPLSAGPRTTYGDDPRKSGGHLVRYEAQEPYYRRDSPPSADDIAAGVRYVQRPLSPASSGRPPSTQYLATEPAGGGRQRASSVGHRRGPSLNTELARMTIENNRAYDQYEDYTPDSYRPTYYPLSPMPSPGMSGRDRGFNVDVGGNFSLGSPMGGANLGYSAHASSSHGHSHGHHRSRSSTRGDYIRPEEKRRPVEPKYDPRDHAQILYKALKGKVADVGSVVKIVPLLSGEQIISLRAEYKKVHPLGNVNLAKHLKAQLSGKIQLAAYVTALGPYESESYWATLSGQKPNFRHALLIEALMGRENDDIMDIRESYRDAKNDNNFEKALTKELTADKGTNEKFKELVLTQLDARGMNEWDKVYLDKVRDDAEDIHDALLKDKVDSLVVGKIIITRSTTHVREMMRLYKKLFNQDLARLIAEKITGLIGEALLHVLNGVLNKPARDARLLEESMKGVGTRDDLLVARLVRIHWDPDHMAAVKDAYKAKYGMSLKERIQNECSGSYQEFLINMIQVDTHTTAVVKH